MKNPHPRACAQPPPSSTWEGTTAPPLSNVFAFRSTGEVGRGPQLQAQTQARFAVDALVYELYGLTAEEIKIVEGTA
jgi:hypothetical protein